MILIGYLALWIALWVRRNGITHPMVWYNAIWITVVYLHSLQLSGLLTPISTDALNVFFSVFTVLNFSSLVFLIYFERKAQEFPYPVLSGIKPFSDKKISKLFWANFCFFLLECVVFRGAPLLWILTGDSRDYGDFGIPTFHGLVMGLNLLLFTYYSAIRPKGNGLKIIGALAMGILSVNRQVIISMFFQWIISYLLINGSFWRLLKNTAGIGSLVMAFFIGMGNLRSDTSVFLERAELLSANPVLLSLSWIYVYIVMSFQNIISIINNLHSHYYGVISSTSFMPSAIRIFVLGMPKGMNLEAEIYKFIPSLTFNVSGYMAEIYMDFGRIGLIIFNFILGFFCARMFARYKANPLGIRHILSLAVFGQCLVLSFFFNMFLYLPILFQFYFASRLFGESLVERPEFLTE